MCRQLSWNSTISNMREASPFFRVSQQAGVGVAGPASRPVAWPTAAPAHAEHAGARPRHLPPHPSPHPTHPLLDPVQYKSSHPQYKSVELRDANTNVLLGQYHLEGQGRFVKAHPGVVVRRSQPHDEN